MKYSWKFSVKIPFVDKLSADQFYKIPYCRKLPAFFVLRLSTDQFYKIPYCLHHVNVVVDRLSTDQFYKIPYSPTSKMSLNS